LKREYQVDTLEGAEMLLKDLQESVIQAEREYELELFEFKAKWGALLNG
jgi:hypothetical protein